MITIFVLFTACVTCLKVGIISDVHLVKYYNDKASIDDFCEEWSTNKTLIQAPLGRYGCDSPPVLVEYMFRRYKEAFGEPDLLLFQGDHITHGLAQYLPPPGNTSYYDIALDTLKDYAGMLNEAFPNSMILPVIGNNDNKFHNEGTIEE